jgi:hypothetical protein
MWWSHKAHFHLRNLFRAGSYTLPVVVLRASVFLGSAVGVCFALAWSRDARA